MARVVSWSIALAFLTNMSEKCKYAQPSAFEAKVGEKTISVEEKLDVIRRLEKGE
jgi:hypothetical protein